jgi:hypothetical protein
VNISDLALSISDLYVDVEMHLSEIAKNATLTLKGNKDRLIPVLTDKTCRVPTLTAVGPLKYVSSTPRPSGILTHNFSGDRH